MRDDAARAVVEEGDLVVVVREHEDAALPLGQAAHDELRAALGGERAVALIARVVTVHVHRRVNRELDLVEPRQRDGGEPLARERDVDALDEARRCDGEDEHRHRHEQERDAPRADREALAETGEARGVELAQRARGVEAGEGGRHALVVG